MTDFVGADRSALGSSRAARWIGASLAAVFLVGVGYVLGHSGAGIQWREGSAYVGEGQASIGSDDWQYGISQSVAWIDETGSHHEGGWPKCLEVPAGTTVEGVRFASVNVDADGLGWREVVLVDCQRR